VLSITVPPVCPRLQLKGKYLIRNGTRNRPLSPTQLRRLMMERGGDRL